MSSPGEPTDDALPYRELPPAPAELRGATALVRLVDGLGFRYRWATEGLRDEHLAFRSAPDAMTLGEVLDHMLRLVEWVERTVAQDSARRREPRPDRVDALRRRTLEALLALRAHLLETSDERLAALTITGSRSRGPQPFWSAINGPLADFLTHVGQVTTWRRQAGAPAPAADVFRGLPP